MRIVTNAAEALEIVLTFPVEYRKMDTERMHGGCQDEKNKNLWDHR